MTSWKSKYTQYCIDGVSCHAWTSDEARYFCKLCGYVYPDAVPIPEQVKRRRRHHSRRNIVLVQKRDGRRCSYCGESFTSELKPTLDHRVPRMKGGTSRLTNLVAACGPCNNEKGWMDEEDYRAMIAKPGYKRKPPARS